MVRQQPRTPGRAMTQQVVQCAGTDCCWVNGRRKVNCGHPERCSDCQQLRTVARCGKWPELKYLCAVCFTGWYEQSFGSSACQGAECVAARQRMNDAVAVPPQPAAPDVPPNMEYPPAAWGACAAPPPPPQQARAGPLAPPPPLPCPNPVAGAAAAAAAAGPVPPPAIAGYIFDELLEQIRTLQERVAVLELAYQQLSCQDRRQGRPSDLGRRPSDLGIVDKDQQHVQKVDLCGSSEVVVIDEEEQLVKHAGAELNVARP